jgi:hypothetical protein
VERSWANSRIKALALLCFAFYLFYNIFHIAHGRLPSSILKEITGLPCPTTGCTRSILSLLEGKIYESFLWNPLSIPFVVLLLISLVTLSRNWLIENDAKISKTLAYAWISSLSAAWIAKFIIGSSRW